MFLHRMFVKPLTKCVLIIIFFYNLPDGGFKLKVLIPFSWPVESMVAQWLTVFIQRDTYSTPTPRSKQCL